MSARESYMPVAPQIVGTAHDWSTAYYLLAPRTLDRDEAIRQGLRQYGSDDFNIAVLDAAGTTLLRLDWMHEVREWDADEIRECAVQLGLAYPPASAPVVPSDGSGQR